MPRARSPRFAAAHPVRKHPASPVGAGLLLGTTLDLSAVPNEIILGDAIPESRAAVYAALLQHSRIPVQEPTDTDSSVSFLQRALEGLQERFRHVPFNVVIGNAEQFDEDGDSEISPDLVGVCIYPSDALEIDAYPFVKALEHKRLVAASLIEEFVRASVFTLETFGPSSAIETAIELRYSLEKSEWWEQQRYDLAYERKVEVEEIPWSEVRKELRRVGMITPGQYRSMIGPEYRIIEKNGPLSIDACLDQLAGEPELVRSIGTAFGQATWDLQRISKKVRRSLSHADHDFRCSMPSGRDPAMFIETTESTREKSGLVYEMLNESFQYHAQTQGFGPACAFLLEPNARSVRRFETMLESIEQASLIAQIAAGAFEEFNTALGTDPGEDEDDE